MNFLYSILFVIGGILLAGCSTTQAIYKNYDAMVNAADGVSDHEAKLIAQRDILRMVERRNYRITAPDVKTTPQALKYDQYWFVVFGHNWLSPISTDPMARTYTELRETQYLVVVDRVKGDIIFSGEWYPKRSAEFDWIFNPEIYRKDNPLSGPAGTPGTVEVVSPSTLLEEYRKSDLSSQN